MEKQNANWITCTIILTLYACNHNNNGPIYDEGQLQAQLDILLTLTSDKTARMPLVLDCSDIGPL